MAFLSLVVVAALAAPNDDTPWLPVQASAAALGQLDTMGATTLGANLYLGATLGHPGSPARLAPLEGLLWGVGLHGFIGSTALADCNALGRCAARRYVGAAARVGWGFAQEVQANGRVWPDTYLYAQVSPFVGWESLPAAPLSPGNDRPLVGMRLDVGLTSVGWTRLLFKGMGQLAESTTSAEAGYLLLILVPLSLLNHVELNLEWSSAALSPPGLRLGCSLGTSF